MVSYYSFFYQQGRVGQRALTTKSFKFAIDAARRKFATVAHDEASKNHCGGVSEKPSNKKEARIYETEDQNNGYKALKLYLEKIKLNCSAFFQYPKANVSPEDDVWFEQRPLGVNTLANMMKTICEVAGAVQNIHKPQHESDGDNIVVQCWHPESTYHVHFRPLKRAVPRTLQLLTISFTASKLQ